jgi:thiamine-phosphate pyrophosphorylase
MKLCLVTDRRRLGAAVGARPGDWLDVVSEQVVAAGRAGVDYVQVREPDLDARELTALVGTLMRGLEGTATKLLVNDRVDVALVSGASGVHLKEQGILPELVRRMAPPGFVIGCSIHSAASIDARKAADLLIAGTVLPTASKRAPDYLEEKGLRQLVERAAGQPVLGIGGLDERSVPLLVSSGAAGMAAVGAFIPAKGESESQRVHEFVQKRVSALRFALDHATRHT